MYINMISLLIFLWFHLFCTFLLPVCFFQIMGRLSGAVSGVCFTTWAEDSNVFQDSSGSIYWWIRWHDMAASWQVWTIPLNAINNILWFQFPFCSPFSRFRCFWGKNRHGFFQTSNMTCCSLTTFCPQALPWCLRLGDWDASDGCSATGSEDFWIGVWTGQNGLLRKRYDFWFWLIQIRKFGGKFGRLFWYKKDPNNIRFLFSTAFGWAISKGSKDRVG